MSTVTISIEEFEDLIACKRKFIRIKTLQEANVKEIKECNERFAEYAREGNRKACEDTLKAQDIKNIICLSRIEEVIKSYES